ncbi:MAG TPA: glycoside hydrolase family 66 protein [Balneolales bacterium]|nr:glycoside hydrolase family 66 protein [Balneolales bacterium]
MRILILCFLLFSGCKGTGPVGSGIQKQSDSLDNISMSINKAIYNPNEKVTFTLNRSVSTELWVRYKHLDQVINEVPVNDSTWNWTAPSTDFTGYMAELYHKKNDKDSVLATIGIDVSSSWTRYPRYGFLSDFSKLSQSRIHSVISQLNRYHINGIQFYDWQYEHHKMLAGTVSNPDSVWKNIGNDDVYFSTVSSYINEAHQHNMKAMFYDLVYGALDDAASDGVSSKWYLYTDQNHNNKEVFPLPKPPFRSDIYLLDPSNTGWQDYIINQSDKVYAALGFDGYHMDQLGNRDKSLYTYDGTSVDLQQTFQPFIEAVKQKDPGKFAVMNAVNQYGQQGIANAPTDFLYTEVWSPNEGYKDLARIIKDNNLYSNDEKNSVLAAYVNYDMANTQGYFNTPSVLMLDAVIFAFGGSHIELGEHMLGKEYFPNNNLSMKSDLKKEIVSYYDFLVAYENLLRGQNGIFNNPELTAAGQIKLNKWPPQTGQVSVVGKKVGNREVIHLLNFTDATTLNWRDNNGVQAYPYDVNDVPLTFTSSQKVKKIWYATPDNDEGASQTIHFTQTGNNVTFTLPYLKYWDMIVIEYQ